MSSRGKFSVGAPTRLRSFDPVRLADLEYRAWVGYYLRRWPQVLIASIGLVNRHGVDTTAAFTVSAQLWAYIQMPAMAIGAAVSAMAAQNIGAGRWDRVDRITRSGLLSNLVLTGAMVGVFKAEWPHEALDMAAQAAGYADFDVAVAADPSLKDELAVREMEWEP